MFDTSSGNSVRARPLEPSGRGRSLRTNIWFVTFMHCDLGYFDDETCRLEPIANPFGPKVLPMCSE
jgi:hypothetical protein